MEILEKKELLDLITASKKIKLALAQNFFDLKTYGAVVDFVESRIASLNLKPAFPTLVLPDRLISNETPLRKNFNKFLDWKICTVDFGLRSKSGFITDLAISKAKPKELKILIDIYRKAIKDIEVQINRTASIDNFTAFDLMNICSSAFSKITQFKVIWALQGHVIKKNRLHDFALPMTDENPGYFDTNYCSIHSINNKKPLLNSKNPLKVSHLLNCLICSKATEWAQYCSYLKHIKLKNNFFTIEPHVYIVEKGVEPKMFSLKSTIVEQNGFFDSIDCRLKNLKVEDLKYFSSTSKPPLNFYNGNLHTNLTFYEENTYYLGKRLYKLT